MNAVKSCLLFAVLCATGAAFAAQCTVTTGERRVPLLELYTSEGCSSCPPADRWVSGLAARGLTADRIVTLAFHVDYWNYLGWGDRFAQARFSERQQLTSNRNQARFVYTPQLVLNGKDFRRTGHRDDFAHNVAMVNGERPQVRISLRQETAGHELTVVGSVDAQGSTPRDAGLYLALYENNLASVVTAGENAGKVLKHDFVVRDFAGPWVTTTSGVLRIRHRFTVHGDWKPANLAVAAFVQDPRSGDVLQSLSAPLCH